jgi:hypothetical protein
MHSQERIAAVVSSLEFGSPDPWCHSVGHKYSTFGFSVQYAGAVLVQRDSVRTVNARPRSDTSTR